MIVLGRIVAPYGVHGWVKLHAFGDDPAAWGGIEDWWLGATPDGKEWQRCRLHELRPHGKGWIASFVGVADRDGAERLEGMYVAAPRDALPKTGRDEFYWVDLVGLAVENEQGERLGRVVRLMETGANAVLVVTSAEGEDERLLPFVSAVVKEVDVHGGVIRVAWGKDW